MLSSSFSTSLSTAPKKGIRPPPLPWHPARPSDTHVVEHKMQDDHSGCRKNLHELVKRHAVGLQVEVAENHERAEGSRDEQHLHMQCIVRRFRVIMSSARKLSRKLMV